MILIFVRELVSPSFVCFSLLHYAGDLWVQMSVLVSRIDLLFASGIGEKTRALQKHEACHSFSWEPGLVLELREKKHRPGGVHLGIGKGLFFFFFSSHLEWMFSKGTAIILDVCSVRTAPWAHGRAVCPPIVCDLTGVSDIEQIITQLDLSLKIVVKSRKEKQ